MIPLFTADDPPVRNALVYNGLTFNQEISGSKKDIIEVNFATAATVYEDLKEKREFTDGMEVYGTFKRAKRFVLVGLVRAATKADLFDRLDSLAETFDPSLAAHNNPDTFGFLPFDFDVPTADTTNYPSGVKACRYYFRAEQAVEPPQRLKQGLAVPYKIVLLAADPRRYLQSTSSLTGAGNADNSLASYWSWPTLTIAMSGAGNAAFEIANDATGTSLVLDLSGRSNGESVAVDMETEKITVGGVETPSLYVSGDYFPIEAGTNNITITNGTNASATLTWRPAFSA